MTPAESGLEREISNVIMDEQHSPVIRRVAEGQIVMADGQPGSTVALILDGLFAVMTRDEEIAEIGPGVLVGSIGVATLLMAILSGCAVSTARPRPSEAVSATAPAAETDIAEKKVPRLSDLAPGTLIATGKFDGQGTTGEIQIKANGADHGFDVTLTGLQPVPLAGTSLELNALPPTATELDLQHGFSYYRYDQLSQVPDQTFSTPSAGYGGFETTDPRFMRTAAIWAAPPGAPIGLGSVIATAGLTWDLPEMNAVPEANDHGSTEGARGQVAIGDDGTPVNYRIAPNDTAKGIAERFGITTDDLEWLNPDRFGGRFILANITINLSVDSRGLRW